MVTDFDIVQPPTHIRIAAAQLRANGELTNNENSEIHHNDVAFKGKSRVEWAKAPSKRNLTTSPQTIEMME